MKRRLKRWLVIVLIAVGGTTLLLAGLEDGPVGNRGSLIKHR